MPSSSRNADSIGDCQGMVILSEQQHTRCWVVIFSMFRCHSYSSTVSDIDADYLLDREGNILQQNSSNLIFRDEAVIRSGGS